MSHRSSERLADRRVAAHAPVSVVPGSGRGARHVGRPPLVSLPRLRHVFLP